MYVFDAYFSGVNAEQGKITDMEGKTKIYAIATAIELLCKYYTYILHYIMPKNWSFCRLSTVYGLVFLVKPFSHSGLFCCLETSLWAQLLPRP